MTKNVLITGASGFVGGALLNHLQTKKGYRLTGVDIRVPPGRRPSAFYQLDLLDTKALTDFLRQRRPQVIFHLAGGRSSDLQKMFLTNVQTTKNIFESMGRLKDYHPRVLVVGSAAEYGNRLKRNLIKENDSQLCEDSYGLTKLTQIRIALFHARLGEDVVVARLFNILGPGIPPTMVGGRFAKEIVKLEQDPNRDDFTVRNLQAVRDFLDIRDIASALRLLAGKGRSGEIYNVCSQKAVPVKKLLSWMLAMSHRKKIKYQEDASNASGVLFSVGSNKKFIQATGWQPKYDLRKSIRDTLEFYRQEDGKRS